MDVQTIIKDPDFIGLPDVEKSKVLIGVDPDFAALPEQEQMKVVASFSTQSVSQQAVTSGQIDIRPIGTREPQVQPVPAPITPEMQSTITQGTVGEITEIRSDTFDTAIKNLPASSAQVVKDLYQTVRHPIETAKSVGELALGVANLATPGEQPSEEVARNVGKFFSDRYGSVENIKKTFATDPAGMLLDLSAAVSIGGTALKGVGAVTKSGAVGKVGTELQQAGAIVDPVSVAARAVTGLAKTLPKDLPSNLYQRAVKFSTVIPESDRVRLTRTALTNEIMPTVDGLGKLETSITSLNKEIASVIDKAVDTGKTIPVLKLMRGTKELLHPDSLGALPESGRKAIQKVRKELYSANKRVGRKALTASEAQKLKQTIYRELQGAYAKTMETAPSKNAQMAVARSAKESIEEIVPEVKHLNAQDGSLIELRKAIEKPASRISNHDLISIRPALAATAGGAMGGWPVAIGGLVLGIFGNPKVQAKLAIVVNKLQKKGIQISPEGVGARLGLVEVERATKEKSEE